MGENIYALLGLVVWCTITLVFGPIILLFSLYNRIVVLFAKLFRKDLSELRVHYLVESGELNEDQSWNLFTVFLVDLDSHLDVSNLIESVQTNVLNDPETRHLLSSDFERWGGYVFARRVKNDASKLQHHVREIHPVLELKSQEKVLYDYSLCNEVIKEHGLPLWEILLWNKCSGTSVILFKVHHALADGKTMLKLIEKILQIRREEQHNNANVFLKSPISYVKHNTAHSGSLMNHPFGNEHAWASEPKTSNLAKVTLDFQKIKDIRKKLHVRILPILACLQAEALKSFCEFKGKPLTNNYYRIQCILRGQKLEGTLGNNWSVGFAFVPLDEQNLLRRLCSTNQAFEQMDRDRIREINSFVYYKLLPIFPHGLVKLFYPDPDSFSHYPIISSLIFPFPREPQYSCKINGIAFFASCKPELDRRGLTMATVTNGSEIHVCVRATMDLFKDQEDADIYAACLAQSLESYHSLLLRDL